RGGIGHRGAVPAALRAAGRRLGPSRHRRHGLDGQGTRHHAERRHRLRRAPARPGDRRQLRALMATEGNFYHLTRSSLEDALPRLLAKTLQAGERAVVMLGSPERVDALNTHLWTWDPNSFLPHGSVKDGEADRQPVWLTHLDENPNGAAFLFIADRARSDKVGDYKRCFELFDGRDDAAVAESRERWKAYKAAGHTVVYWQQTPAGGWEKKA